MRLSNKIMLSYMSLLVMAFIIAIVIANTVVTRNLLAKTMTDLDEQALAIVQTLKESKFDIKEPRRVVAYLRNTPIGHLVPSDVYLLNVNRMVVYASNPDIDEATIKSITAQKHKDYVRVIKVLKDDTDNPIGYLMLTTEIRHIEAYTKTLRRALTLGMFVALIIGSVMADFMRRSIVKPIVSLRRDIQKNIDDPTKALKPLKTGDEIEELYDAYITMNQQIKAHLDERKRFFQNASHELKTPLMSIQGYAEAIKDGVVVGEEVDESLEIIIRKSKELKRTVEEIVYLSKLANNDFQYEFVMVNLTAFIASVIEDQSILATDRKVTIAFKAEDRPLMATIDQTKFESCVENLLSNALRYAQTMVKVELKADDKKIILRVIDDGKGLGLDEEEKVFERFYKGDGGNSGIGLAIVSEIVGHHGGTIRAGNHISGGAVFEITLNRGHKND